MEANHCERRNQWRDSNKEFNFRNHLEGFLEGEDWLTPQDVVDCWMSELQGMEEYHDVSSLLQT